MSNLIAEQKDGILVLKLNRPDRGNALSLELLQELDGAIGQARRDDNIRGVAVTASGDQSFCSGADLNFFAAENEIQEATNLFGQVLLGLVALDKPTAAFLNGSAHGGGVGLAFACDEVFAPEQATFALPEVKLGLFPFMIMPILERAFGARQALAMAMAGSRLDALTMQNRGWVSGTFAPNGVDEAIARWSAQRAGLANAAICQGKHLTHQDWLLTLEKRLKEGQKALLELIAKPETQARIKAALAKTPVSAG